MRLEWGTRADWIGCARVLILMTAYCAVVVILADWAMTLDSPNDLAVACGLLGSWVVVIVWMAHSVIIPFVRDLQAERRGGR